MSEPLVLALLISRRRKQTMEVHKKRTLGPKMVLSNEQRREEEVPEHDIISLVFVLVLNL